MLKNSLRIFAILIILPIFFSCNKSFEPITLDGTWTIDTANVNISIIYEKSVAEEHPEAMTFLIKNKEYFRAKLKEPRNLIFASPNIANMKFTDDRGTILGTYTQQDIYFSIKNEIFLDGIMGISDNTRLEIYYNTAYMKELLSQIITPETPSMDVFNSLIKQFDGIGAYRR
ncbi:hypothetical protein SDC9_93208 [bioreactor metagenome]|jgi:hypothetical protein|uniref:Uncharacterized protein n=1 Tax=bioreactor metagenome TaxID=1076179 RepID=A0A644ZZX0_9ZZZZ